MRVKALLFAGLVSVLASEGPSFAEKVKANAEAKVYNRKGEQGKVLVRVKEGQAMTVLAKEGRWLKVRVSGRTGFIPRSYVDVPESDDEIQRNTRRRAFVDGRGTKRGFGGGEAPDDRVGADATGETDTSGAEDDDSGDEKPTKSKPEKAAKKPAKGGDDDEGDDEGDEKPEKPEKMTKKPAKPEKPEKAAKKPAKGGNDDEGDDEDPIEKKTKTKVKPKEDDTDEGAGEEEAEPKDAGDADEEEKDARKKARVSEKTVAFAEADKGSDEAFTAKPNQTLYIEEEKGKWTEVSVDDGDIGWVQTSKLDMDGGGDEDDGGDEGAARGGRRIIDVRARLGFSFFNQTLSSSGGTAGSKWPDKYSVGSTTAAVSLGGDLLYPYKKAYVVGGELTYDYGKAVRGIAFDPDPTDGMPGASTSFSMHALNVRGMFGYDFHKSNGMIVFGRLGYHYEQLLFANSGDVTKNTARLPSETLQGPMIGAAFAIPAITAKLGARISLDAILVAGSLAQTKGLEDGASPSAKKYVLGAGFTYRYKPGITIGVGYDLQRTSVSFGAPVPTSVRGHMGTSVSRTDTNHLVTVGLAKAF